MPARKSGSYYSLDEGVFGTSATLVNGTLRVHPYLVDVAESWTRVGGDVSGAGDAASTIRLCIYLDDGSVPGSFGYPGILLKDFGTIAADSATVQEITTALTLAPGRYWVGGVVQGVTVTQPTVRVLNGALANTPVVISFGTSAPAANTAVSNSLAVTGVTGSLPNPFTASAAASVVVPRLFMKAA